MTDVHPVRRRRRPVPVPRPARQGSRAGRHVVLALAAALPLVAAACGSSGSTSATGAATGTTAVADRSGDTGATNSIEIVTSNNGIQWTPIDAMSKDGIAAAHHLSVKLTVFQNGSGSSSQIFAGGTGDILMAGIDSPVNFANKKILDATVVGTIEKANPWVLVSKKGSAITDAPSLAGKTVGISGAGSFSDYTLRAFLAEQNVSTTGMKIAALGAGPTAIAALTSGNGDAVMVQSPAFENAQSAGTIQIVHNFRQDGPMPAIVALARTTDVTANPQKFRDFFAAWQDEITKMTKDPAGAQAAAAAYLGSTTSAADIKTQLDSFLGGIWSTDGVFDQSLYDAGKTLLVKSGSFDANNYPSFDTMTKGFTAGTSGSTSATPESSN